MLNIKFAQLLYSTHNLRYKHNVASILLLAALTSFIIEKSQIFDYFIIKYLENFAHKYQKIYHIKSLNLAYIDF